LILQHIVLQYFLFSFRVLVLAGLMQRISWNVSRNSPVTSSKLTLTRAVHKFTFTLTILRSGIFLSFSLSFAKN
jgi:hypothetical protein